MKIMFLIIIFLLIGVFFIIGENNINLQNEQDRGRFYDLYMSWLNNVFEDSKIVVGYVVNMDWLPEE